MNIVTSTTSDEIAMGSLPRYLLLHINLENISYLHYSYDLMLYYYIIFNSCYCFRVLHIAFHQVRPVQYGDVVRQELMMFVYTEDSILVLESYVIQELLGSQNNAVIFRYFADMYYTL